MCGECTDCKNLESRVEDLEDFIWTNFVEPGCKHHSKCWSDVYCDAESALCSQKCCPRFKSVMEWRK